MGCLGFDTSCYTTSVALCGAGAAEGVFFQARCLLTVPLGGRGLQQSEMLYQHVKRLPELTEAMLAEHPDVRIDCVCASERPRPDGDSYMPAFRVGEGMARAIAAALGVPYYATTHQQGHLRAARVGTAIGSDTPSLAMHLSGGTTEVLRAQGEDVALLGGTADLHAGQLIDRIGVALGLPFPAGPSLEKLAMAGSASSRLSTVVRGLTCHFSGAEAEALRLLAAGAMAPEDLAAEVFSCVARTVARLAVEGCAREGLTDVLLGGGVASSALIRQDVAARVAKRNRAIRLHFAKPELSGDNAVGVALIGLARRCGSEEEKAWQQR